MGGAFFKMINLKNEPYKRAKLALAKLNAGLVWLETFRRGDEQQKILNYIRDDQLTAKGVDGDGDVIGFYSLTTSFINPEKSFNTPYTLNDTGEFYRSMYITVLKDALIIQGDTLKMEDKKWWTDKILELTDDSLDKLREDYKKRLQDYARDVLLGRR